MHSDDMLDKAKGLVIDYFNGRCDRTDNFELDTDDVFVVWFCKTLQNWKALLSTTISDGMYYEVTYKKWENKHVPDKE